MVRAELHLASLQDLHLEPFRLFPSALVPVCRRQIGYACQRIRMVRAELHLASL
ncbi:hypothetical protein PENSUB_1931 [Penicillium subrubescens]|uniref:Uncharacterized protein n=1 Tax=Penicillium subrubescens TaxID=1316194 RepID=A0A1Q5UIW0_9EURO|nr:hypothetical protein PENSUB_1931 [Penicillium subrubescens]